MSAATTLRRKPRHSSHESAAIALTAQLLSGLKTRAADALHLTPSAKPVKYITCGALYASNHSGNSFQRQHDSKYGTTWLGFETQTDQHARKWERMYYAVVDDFGNLVEVPR